MLIIIIQNVADIGWKLSCKLDVQGGNSSLREPRVGGKSADGVLTQWLDGIRYNIFRQMQFAAVSTYQLLQTIIAKCSAM